MSDSYSKRLEFWDKRSALGFVAGSGDINLKKLEVDSILKLLGNSSTILDAGCGNGFTLAAAAKSFPNSKLFGFDYSKGMVDAATKLMKEVELDQIVSVSGQLLMICLFLSGI